MNDTIDLLRRHRSIRRFTDAPVPDEHIRAAVEAGQAASTSSAVQSYGLLHVTDDEDRRRLADLTGPQPKVAECGAFFVVCGDTRRHRLAAERHRRAYETRLEAFLLATVDASLFAQNLVVAFESLGYGICYIGGLRNSLPEIDGLLALPDGVYPLYGLCVGVPDETPGPRPRLSVDAVFFSGAYPDDDSMNTLVDEYDSRYAQYLRDRGARNPDRTWSKLMADKFAEPQRTDLGGYYRGKGADLS